MGKATLVVAVLLTLVLSSTGQTPKATAKHNSAAKHSVDPQSIISDDVKRHLTAVFDPHDTMAEIKGYVAQARGELKTDADKAVLLNIEKALDSVEASEETSKSIAKSKERTSEYEAHRVELQARIDKPLPPYRILLLEKVVRKGDVDVPLDSGVEFALDLSGYQTAGLRLSLSNSRTLPDSDMATLQSWCGDSAKKVAKQRKWSRSDVDAKCKTATAAMVEKINKECDEEYASETRAYLSPLEAEVEKLGNALTAERTNQAALASKLSDERAEAINFFALTKSALEITGSKDPFIDPESSESK